MFEISKGHLAKCPYGVDFLDEIRRQTSTKLQQLRYSLIKASFYYLMAISIYICIYIHTYIHVCICKCCYIHIFPSHSLVHFVLI